jgi:glycosyltransferase involved in cell wall biosynthesis
MTIGVVIVSLMEREQLLQEALESVRKQTRQPDDIIIGIDPRRLGEVANQNRLLDAVNTDLVAFLHDDDVWYPQHLEACLATFNNDVDVVASRFDLVNRAPGTIEPWHVNWEDMRLTNWFPPSAVVARREIFGRWTDKTDRHCWIDWANWNRLMDEGARFAETGQVTWQYRFGDWGNGSWDVKHGRTP